jgi:hypothetical protein
MKPRLGIDNIDINSPEVTNIVPMKGPSWAPPRDNEIQFDYKGITYFGVVEDGIVKHASLLFIEKYYEY